MITKNETPAAVLISSDEWESLRETRSIRSSASMMKEIRQGLQELRVKNRVVEINAVGPRDRIYEETFQILKKRSSLGSA